MTPLSTDEVEEKISTHRRISTATTNAVSVTTSSTRLYGWSASNVNAAARYLKIYDKASAPTVGTDVPKFTIALPAAGVNSVMLPNPIALTSGLAFAIVTGIGDADATATAANEQMVHLFYR